MYSYADKNKRNEGQSVANFTDQKKSDQSTFQFVDNRPETVAQKKLQEMVNNSPQVAQLKVIQDMADAKNSKHIQTNHSNRSPVIQMVRINKLEDSGKSLDEIVSSMETRAEGTAASMLWDFKEQKEGYRYFVATNEKEGDDERFALMSLKDPAKVKEGENPNPPNPEIDNSIWVEGLVSDPKSGLGGELLKKAESIAEEEWKLSVSLAALELENDDRSSYSVAGYYEKKMGYKYTGEAYEEVDGENSYFYPIYTKEILFEKLQKFAVNDYESLFRLHAFTIEGAIYYKEEMEGILNQASIDLKQAPPDKIKEVYQRSEQLLSDLSAKVR